jgi:transaldolase
MTVLKDLKVKIYMDGAVEEEISRLAASPLIKGITTNPTLMRKAGVTDFEAFVHKTLKCVKDKPISFEVFSDEFVEMRRQAIKLSEWQSNVYVKIPITNTRGESSVPLIRELASMGIKLNITALLTTKQVREVEAALNPSVNAIVSIFAGRIADTGCDPELIIQESLKILKDKPKAELLWASMREVFNIMQAERSGCHIITIPEPFFKKATRMWEQDLAELSLETVKMFFDDAKAAGFSL